MPFLVLGQHFEYAIQCESIGAGPVRALFWFRGPARVKGVQFTSGQTCCESPSLLWC